MPHALVEKALAERDDCIRTVTLIKNARADQGGDPNDMELEAIAKAHARVKQLDEHLKIISIDDTLDEEARGRLLAPLPTTPSGPHYRHGGEMVWDAIHGTIGMQVAPHDQENQEAKRRYDLVLKRAAQHMGTTAEATTPTAGGVGGLYAVPVVGPVIALFPQGQPFLTTIGRRPAPNAMQFVRPRIVDPDFDDGVAVQSLQKAELTSKKFDIKVDTLNLQTIGGYLNVSQQLMSLHADAWNIIVSQMQARLAWAGEKALVAEAEQTGATVTLSATATAAQVLTALFQAAALVYQNTRQLPTWIAYGPTGWARLGSLTDTAGRPLFPFLGAANALGAASLGDFNLGPMGLQQIVTPGIADGTILVGNNFGIEAYSFPFPILEAVEPALLGRQIAIAEALAFYRPTTKEAVTTGTTAPAEQNGIVKVAP
jgi:hypothetical protein